MSESPMLLEAKDIWKSYKSPEGALPILKGLDFSLKRGEIAFILGRSGSGKSTLLHVLSGLDRLDKGTLVFDGKNLTKMNEKEKCRFRGANMGFVFQFYHLLPELTLLENVLLPLFIAKKKKAKEKVRQMLEWVGLSEREKHFPRQLSGGEQQRAALVRALVNEPQIVYCDEPTGNLDEENRGMVMDLLKRLNRENNQTFCIVTHDESLTKMGSAVYRLNGGKLVSY